MRRDAGRPTWKAIVMAAAVALTAIAVLAPERFARIPSQRSESFLPPTWYRTAADGSTHVLGTDYLGRSFLPVLYHAMRSTARIALLGTALVALGCLLLGVIQGSTTSRVVSGLTALGSLGVMAVPEAAVVITLATTWPRVTPPLYVNATIVAALVLFAIPAGAQLIAERVRSVRRTGFVAASRFAGATPWHTFRCEVWPHLTEDLGWIVASVLPRFISVEVGMAYLGVEYRDFEGLGRVLTKSFQNITNGTAVFQLFVTIAAILWLALLPRLYLRSQGMRLAGVAA